MPQTVETPQKRGARTLTERTTPEWRRERARKAALAAAVNAVVNRAPDLSPEQTARLRAIFAPAVQKAA